jgi:hypothetical protein
VRGNFLRSLASRLEDVPRPSNRQIEQRGGHPGASAPRFPPPLDGIAAKLPDLLTCVA